jgi:lysozyme family protein
LLQARSTSRKARYQGIEAATGVPWFMVAVIHEREAGGRWNGHLGQGDDLRGLNPCPAWAMVRA